MKKLANYKKVKAHLKKVYDDLAEYWGKDDTLHDWGSQDLKEFSKLVKTSGGMRVLDLGCGSGVQSMMLAAEGLKVVGLDLSSKMIKEAQRRVPSANFVVGDMTAMGFKNGSFDGVYARASLLHIPKSLIPKVLNEIKRVLKAGGILYLAVKEGDGEREVEDARHGKKVKRFFAFFREEEMRNFLGEGYFKINKIKKFLRKENSTPWLLVFAHKI